jgi:hypothetical protein
VISPLTHTTTASVHSLLAANSVTAQTTGEIQAPSIPIRNTNAVANWYSGSLQSFSDAFADALQMKSEAAPGKFSGLAPQDKTDARDASSADSQLSAAPPVAVTTAGVQKTPVSDQPENEPVRVKGSQSKPDNKSDREPARTEDRQNPTLTPQVHADPQACYLQPPGSSESQANMATSASVTLGAEAVPSSKARNSAAVAGSHQDEPSVSAAGPPFRAGEPLARGGAPDEAISHDSDVPAFRLNLQLAAPVSLAATPELPTRPAKPLPIGPPPSDEQGTPTMSKGDGAPTPAVPPTAGATQTPLAERQTRSSHTQDGDGAIQSNADRQGGPAPANTQPNTENLIGQTGASATPLAVPTPMAKPQTAASPLIIEAPRALENPAATTAPKEMIMRVEGVRGEVISVRVADQAGHIQVAVRSNDAATASLLRQDLPSLMNTLDRMGWKAGLGTGPTPHAIIAQQPSQHDGATPQRDRDGSALGWNQDPERKKHSTPELWDEALDAQERPANVSSISLSRHQ